MKKEEIILKWRDCGCIIKGKEKCCPKHGKNKTRTMKKLMAFKTFRKYCYSAVIDIHCREAKGLCTEKHCPVWKRLKG